MITHIYDSVTGGHILTSERMPAPTQKGRQLQLDLYVEEHKTSYLYYIEEIEPSSEYTIAYVTLQKVYVDDIAISIS